MAFPIVTPEAVRADLLEKGEIALIDVREEGPHATGHPLFAANLPLSLIELEAYTRLPRRTVRIVLLDNGEGLVERAAQKLAAMDYSNVGLLDGGVQGWRDEGYELFIDVNAPSKAFGELVEVKRHTPSFSAPEVKQMLASGADCVYVDVRRYDEFQTMSIPGATSVPGAELVLRIRELAPRPETQIIVNCAGRTRSIIGTQSLINSGIPNRVAALRNGTIGWKLAKQALDHGATRSGLVNEISAENHAAAVQSARSVADKAGVERLSLFGLDALRKNENLTIYCFDVRTQEEFLASHLPGFLCAPGGQLVQEVDMVAPVRGAQIVLADTDGTRANMTASWLAQMGWSVYVLDDIRDGDLTASGSAPKSMAPLPEIPATAFLEAPDLRSRQASEPSLVVLDLSPSMQYKREHISGSSYALRTRLEEALRNTSYASSYVLTSPDGLLAQFTFPEMRALTTIPVLLLKGGNQAWKNLAYPVTHDGAVFASEPLDRYQRPYEGNEASEAAMQGYLDWEAGLVDQLDRDGTHGFFVI